MRASYDPQYLSPSHRHQFAPELRKLMFNCSLAIDGSFAQCVLTNRLRVFFKRMLCRFKVTRRHAYEV